MEEWITVENNTLVATGDWTLDSAEALENRLTVLFNVPGIHRKHQETPKPPANIANIDATKVSGLDTAGAWLLWRTAKSVHPAADDVRVLNSIQGLNSDQQFVLQRVAQLGDAQPPLQPRINPVLRIISNVGQGVADAFDLSSRFTAFIGRVVVELGILALRPKRWRVTSLVHHMEISGFNALPIVGLISFLIGIVLAYQGAIQLQYFGAEVFVVDLIAVSITRELGILLAAIVIAGRTSSAFTAEIGSMKVNEELDALHTMGVSYFEVLVVPRVLALFLTLPLLAFFADVMGLIGGAVMSWVTLDISPQVFVTRLQDAITPESFWIGIIKAPVFGLVIALIGCFEGLEVKSSAESVGDHTTRSVVEAIFLIIVLDAMFSVFFGLIGW